MAFMDVSANQGKIDWSQVDTSDKLVIIRSTTKNGKLDTRAEYNSKNAFEQGFGTDYYKFMYAMTEQDAYNEMCNALDQVALINRDANTTMWIDLEKVGTHTHTQDEACLILTGAIDACNKHHIDYGIYCNAAYLKNVIPAYFKRNEKFWIARYNSSMTKGYEKAFEGVHVQLWQYTDKGFVKGVPNNVDLNRRLDI